LNALQQRIRKEAENLGQGILKVTSFINHQVDPLLLDQCGRELASRFSSVAATKVLTAETGGIVPALMTALYLHVPLIYARKTKPITLPERVFQTTVSSHTKKRREDLFVSPEYLQLGDRVLLIDDFLAFGHTILSLASLVRMADATVVGVGVVIEKAFEEGRVSCGSLEVPIEALATVLDMSGGEIVLA